jgi:hypothetical protein
MAATLTGSYDPSQVIVSIGGVTLSGFSDGDAIIARRSEDAYSMRAGNDGGVGRARNPNMSGEFEFKLLQTSAVNAALSALVATDDLTNQGLPTFPISIFDGSGASLAVASACWIKTVPEMTMGKEVGERTWVFSAADLRLFFGGNA